nr:MAG TPA: hypothetical protein [Caudoviricetes sp.]
MLRYKPHRIVKDSHLKERNKDCSIPYYFNHFFIRCWLIHLSFILTILVDV